MPQIKSLQDFLKAMSGEEKKDDLTVTEALEKLIKDCDDRIDHANGLKTTAVALLNFVTASKDGAEAMHLLEGINNYPTVQEFTEQREKESEIAVPKGR